MLPDLCPPLRRDVEVLLVEEGEEEALLLQDPEHYAPEVARLSPAAIALLRYFDGRHTFERMRERLHAQGAEGISAEDLRAFADALDRHFLLDSARFAAERGRREVYRSSSVRRAAHAGGAYPAEAERASAFLQGMLGMAPEGERGRLRRLIAPHIDLRLGAETYAYAHRRLAAAGRPDLVIVLGVCHAYCDEDFVACRKDFATPLGVVRHDGAFLDALEARLGRSLTDGDLVHRDEHSVEFQTLWLAHLWPEDPPPIVPFLVRGFHGHIESGTTPAEDLTTEAFLGALRSTIEADARDILVLASVDLAHMGPMYGHEQGLDADGERQLARDDESLLAPVLRGDAEGFFRAVAEGCNNRNICGTGPIYVALRLGEGPGRLLRYGQGRIHPESGSVVSFAALAFPD